MIRIYCDPKGRKISFSGHAGYADAGSDIVCAAVSCLYYTLECSCRHTHPDGDENSIKLKGGIKERVILSAVQATLLQLCQSYPRNITLTVKK